MAQNYEAGNPSSEDDTAKRKRNRNRRDRRNGEQTIAYAFSSPYEEQQEGKISSQKIWGVSSEVLCSLGFYFVQDEFMHLGFNEVNIPAELRPHLPPLTAKLNPQRTADDPPASQLQAELLNKRLQALKPGTMYSLDGQLRFHLDEPDFPATFQKLLALRDARLHGAGAEQRGKILNK